MCLPGTMEKVREQTEAEGGPTVDRRTAILGAACLAVAHLHRDADGRGRRLDLGQEARQVACQVVEVAAGRHDVDEAEQRGLELGVARGEVHRLVVERLQRAARGRRQALPQAPADLVQFAFQRGFFDHAADDIGRQVTGGVSARRATVAPHSCPDPIDRIPARRRAFWTSYFFGEAAEACEDPAYAWTWARRGPA